MGKVSFNNNWKFLLGNEPGAHLLEYDDASWRNVQIPHDWSVEKDFDPVEGEACTAFLTGGFGWYRKKFRTTEEMRDQNVYIVFDGIYNRSTVYVNGEKVKFHPYGYSPLCIDVTGYLYEVGEENIIAVAVDHERYADSRWYTGSGIYRKVSMYILPKVHIPVWGTFFTTPFVTAEKAVACGKITLVNDKIHDENLILNCYLYDSESSLVEKQERNVLIYKGSKREIDISFQIENPVLWDIHKGNMYSVTVEIVSEKEVIQSYQTRFGIREFRFDPEKGFFLNGISRKIKGVCLHHDGGAVGAAVPLAVWRRRLEKLQECGCNAIRTAHNPASEDFLNLCDEMGFLVQEEFYDEWDNPKDKRNNGTEFPDKVNFYTRGHAEFFQEYAKSDLQNTILRDRNHPCIFQWSIGNEIEWTYPKYNAATGYFNADASGNYFWTLPPYSREKIKDNIRQIPREHYEIGETAHKLAAWTKEMDVTRPVVANCILPSASYESGYTDALDIVGFSYRQVVYDYCHENYPDKPILGTENLGQWHEWKAVLEREFVSGIFIWTGVDYLGEAGRGNPWPVKGTSSGLIDFCGFEKPSYHMFKALWNEEPHIHMETQRLEDSLYEMDADGVLVEKVKDNWKHMLWLWQDVNPYWAYREGEKIVIEAYTNCECAELFCNDKSYGIQYLKDHADHILKWVIPYETGQIKVKGIENQKYVVEDELVTPSDFEALSLEADKNELHADVDDAVHVVLALRDQMNRWIRHQEQEVIFHVSGPCRICSVDNGSKQNVYAYQGKKIETYQGRAMLVIQADKPGIIEVTAECGNVISNKVTINVK